MHINVWWRISWKNVYLEYRREDRMVTVRQMNETSSGSCPMAEFGISGAEPSGSATTMLISILYCLLSTHKNLFLDLSIFRQL
jgi:hypothetical protein